MTKEDASASGSGSNGDGSSNAAEAKELYQAAYEELDELCGVLEETTDQACLYELGQVQFWLGNGYFLSADSNTALEYLADYTETSQRLVELYPRNTDYLLELAMSYSNLAVLHNDMGNTQTAFEHTAKAIAIGEQLHRVEPTHQDAALSLANAYCWSGKHRFRDQQ